MRFTGRPRCEYAVTDRKRAAAVRWQKQQRDSLNAHLADAREKEDG